MHQQVSSPAAHYKSTGTFLCKNGSGAVDLPVKARISLYLDGVE